LPDYQIAKLKNMQNPRLATRYAKSLLDLAVERNSLEVVLKDMQALHRICAQSRDFEVMLRSPVIHGDKKLNVFTEVMKNYGVNELTMAFIALLVNKGREQFLPEIAAAFVTQYNDLKNITLVKLTTARPVNDTVKTSIVKKLSGYLPNDTIDLKTEVNEDLIGGFVLEVEDKLYDASVKKSLNEIRAGIIDMSYVSKV
jgi:F-type H+-transporting ATPase subunit delta